MSSSQVNVAELGREIDPEVTLSTPILPRFRDMAGFLLRTAISPLFHGFYPNFGGVPFGLDCRR